MNALPVSSEAIISATLADPVLSQVLTALHTGWPENRPAELTPYWWKRDKLTVEGNCILWGVRVVVLSALRSTVLQELHMGHPGVVRVWSGWRLWPASVFGGQGLTRIGKTAKDCTTCQEGKNAPPKAHLHPWAWPTAPWEHIHVDYAGPVDRKMLLITTNAHSKWPEVCVTTQTTSSEGTSPSLGMANCTMGVYSCGLWWSCW